MRNLRNFIIRHYFFLCFLLLQVVSVTLLVRTHNHHRKVFMSSASVVTGKLLETRQQVEEYFRLSEINTALQDENARLRQMLPSSLYDSVKGVYRPVNPDWITQYRYLPATVIGGTVNQRNNCFTLNRGSVDGVEPDMGVIAQHTVVGFVSQVTRHYCTVITVLNEKFSQSVRMPSNGEHGLIHWDGRDARLLELTGIPLDATVNGGDSVFTSSASGRFPHGQLVGTVYSVTRRQGSGHHYILIKLTQSLNRVHKVYIIKNRFRRELDSLQSQSNGLSE